MGRESRLTNKTKQQKTEIKNVGPVSNAKKRLTYLEQILTTAGMHQCQINRNFFAARSNGKKVNKQFFVTTAKIESRYENITTIFRAN